MDQDTDRIKSRLEYLDHIEETIKNSRPVLKFQDWAARTLEAINKIHSKMHIQVRSLKNILREEPNGA